MSERAIDIPRMAGQHVRRRRKELGMTQTELARAAGVSLRTITYLELGDSAGIRLDKLMAIAAALDMRLALVDAPDTKGTSSVDADIAACPDEMGVADGQA